MDATDLFDGRSVSFACRLFGALDQPGIGDKVLDCGETVDVMDLVEDDQGQALTDGLNGRVNLITVIALVQDPIHPLSFSFFTDWYHSRICSPVQKRTPFCFFK